MAELSVTSILLLFLQAILTAFIGLGVMIIKDIKHDICNLDKKVTSHICDYSVHKREA